MPGDVDEQNLLMIDFVFASTLRLWSEDIVVEGSEVRVFRNAQGRIQCGVGQPGAGRDDTRRRIQNALGHLRRRLLFYCFGGIHDATHTVS